MRFAFCTAWPAAPFIRLSIAATTINVGCLTCAAIGDTHPHDIPTDHVAQRRRGTCHFDEWLTRVFLLPDFERIGDCFTHRHRNRRQNSARHGKKVWNENQIVVSTQCLYDRAHLWEVAVFVPQRVRSKVFGYLSEQQVWPKREACARHTARCRDRDRRPGNVSPRFISGANAINTAVA
jgi:hypothetical protein